jgi:membrane protease YdiL (CAAX protease family)
MLVYFLLTSGKCIIYTWIYQSTGGSVLATVLFHAVNNTSVPLISLPGIGSGAGSDIWMISVIPIWITAVFLMARFGSYTLSTHFSPKDNISRQR